jgi:RNA polymerase sigma-70 factor (ECF subfamily)
MRARRDGRRSPNGRPDDERLAARVAAGDRHAFGLLYDRYARTVYVLAAHLIGPAQAEEIVQEVFLTLWDKAHQFDGARGPFGAWFLTIARNRVLDELRRRSVEQRLLLVEPIEQLLSEAPDGSSDVPSEADERAQGTALLRALAALPPEQRRVLVLSYFGGLPHAAISEALELPLGTVKKRLQLGMRKLRLSLAEDVTATLREARR